MGFWKAAHESFEWKPAMRELVELIVFAGVVQHFTAAGSGRAVARWVAGETIVKGKLVPPARYFGHFITCRDGHVIQQARLDQRCNHAAGLNRGQWLAVDDDAEINDFTIGIENSNYGWLMKSGSKFFVPRKNRLTKRWEAGKQYPRGFPQPQRAVGHDGVDRWWEPFTEELLRANEVILRCLRDLEPTAIRRHSDLSPDRKFDPGPLFPARLVNGRALMYSALPPEASKDEMLDDVADLIERRLYDPDEELCLIPDES